MTITAGGGGGNHASSHYHNGADPLAGDLYIPQLRPDTGSTTITVRKYDRGGTLCNTILQPESNNYCDLGTGALRWRKLYVVGLGSSDYYVTNGYIATLYINTGIIGSGYASGMDIRLPNAGYVWTAYGLNQHGYVVPQTADYGYVGTAANYHYAHYANYVYYKTLGSFDAVDDVGILRAMKAHPTEKDRKGLPVVDVATIPDAVKAFEPDERQDGEGKTVVSEGTQEFVDLGALTGLVIGAIKQMADKIDELTARIVALEGRSIDRGK